VNVHLALLMTGCAFARITKISLCVELHFHYAHRQNYWAIILIDDAKFKWCVID
jgi:hypothetical protein